MTPLPPSLHRQLQDLARFGHAHDAREASRERRFLNLDWDSAEALYLLVRMSRRRAVLEIGTSNGFSTLWLAQALSAQPDARLTTIERDGAKQKEARHSLEQAGLQNRITWLCGDGDTYAEQLEGPFDCLFFDADRLSARRQLELLLPKCSPDALLLCDNALSHADELAGYLAFFENNPAFASSLLPVGKGLHVALRQG
ncbi:putative O-methyltransferase [mine drainage metagenome]|uniref:Putative O-methyltransferase n=1 Tax=mine drainage metagenome TaxID=410659 RepID=A0A1J5RL12_9ZZZZ